MQWKKSTSLILALYFATAGCGMKKRPAPWEGLKKPSPSVSLPNSVFVSSDARFLIRPSTLTVPEFGDSLIHYRVVDETLLPASKTDVKATFIMPTMKEMGVMEAQAHWIEPGELEVIFPIPHGGAYEARLSFGSSDKTVIVHSFHAGLPAEEQ